MLKVIEMLTFCISGIQVDTFIQAHNDSGRTMISNRCFVKYYTEERRIWVKGKIGCEGGCLFFLWQHY